MQYSAWLIVGVGDPCFILAPALWLTQQCRQGPASPSAGFCWLGRRLRTNAVLNAITIHTEKFWPRAIFTTSMTVSTTVRTIGTPLYQYAPLRILGSRVLFGGLIRYLVFGFVRQTAQRESLRGSVRFLLYVLFYIHIFLCYTGIVLCPSFFRFVGLTCECILHWCPTLTTRVVVELWGPPLVYIELLVH